MYDILPYDKGIILPQIEFLRCLVQHWDPNQQKFQEDPKIYQIIFYFGYFILMFLVNSFTWYSVVGHNEKKFTVLYYPIVRIFLISYHLCYLDSVTRNTTNPYFLIRHQGLHPNCLYSFPRHIFLIQGAFYKTCFLSLYFNLFLSYPYSFLSKTLCSSTSSSCHYSYH